jgi:hypothetical protein
LRPGRLLAYKPERWAGEENLATNIPDFISHDVLRDMWREVCERGKTVRFKMISGSMSPMIEVDDIVTVSHAEPSALRIGDVIAFMDNRNIIVHRIVDVKRSEGKYHFRHKGDAGVASGMIAMENVIGRVTIVEKEGRDIHLGSLRYRITGKILGWRLKTVYSLGNMKFRRIGSGIRFVVRPFWRVCRNVLSR